MRMRSESGRRTIACDRYQNKNIVVKIVLCPRPTTWTHSRLLHDRRLGQKCVSLSLLGHKYQWTARWSRGTPSSSSQVIQWRCTRAQYHLQTDNRLCLCWRASLHFYITWLLFTLHMSGCWEVERRNLVSEFHTTLQMFCFHCMEHVIRGVSQRNIFKGR